MSLQFGGTLLVLPKASLRRRPILQLPRASSSLTFHRSKRMRTPAKPILKPSPVVKFLALSRPWVISNQVCPCTHSLHVQHNLEIQLLVAFDIKPVRDVSMPSTETQGQQPGEHTGGVGPLPGPSDEQGVAVLPEERETKTTEVVRPERREEPGNLPDETKESTDARGVGVGGTTDPLKESTQSRVCIDILSAVQ